MSENRIKQLVSELNLSPHREGGFYKEIYRSTDNVLAPERFGGEKPERLAATLIYYLLSKNDFSAFHRIKSDETWIYLEGSPLLVHVLDKNTKKYSINKVGPLSSNVLPNYTVPYGNWFAAEVEDQESYSLVSCFVAPGFEFRDFEMADRQALLEEYSDHHEIIKKLTR